MEGRIKLLILHNMKIDKGVRGPLALGRVCWLDSSG